ncbi:glutamine synthetase family protein [Gulosibacter molinativorax]|uniref:Glutamine synthetase n=1 Tax=Gulosibacter molinativorax TaxID=256821 RepID=A0ABT7CBD9_9MICO|nr:glutamine synthetase family protein [Gulosibacter molinativorax]MDJ1372515.1 glutamine synthetase [Gulosibacter molinativorax]QUY61158.1 Glutamine synthetase [Gulosibacter molinativorax]
MSDLTTGGRFGAALREILADDTAFSRHQAANLRPETVQALGDRIRESGVKYIYYMLPTLGSRTVAKVVPAELYERMLKKGIAFHRTALTDLQTSREGELIGGGVDAHEFWGLPEPETFQVLPWDTEVGRIFCTAYDPPHLGEGGGRLVALDTRALFKAAHRGFTERTGLELRSGLEPEMTWIGPGIEPISKQDQSPAYQVENLEKMRPVYKKVISYGQALDFTMIQGDYEDDGQIELNWDYDRADLTAERMTTYRQICKQVARELGLEASFMAKPYNGKMGNGCHHNLSLWRVSEDGPAENVIEDGRVELHATQTARHAIGGLLLHTPGSMLVMASTVNSYKRYWDAGQFAPSGADWGLDTRGVAIRISANGRMEYRLPDASVNPYLSHLYLLAAIEYGLEAQIDPGDPGQLSEAAQGGAVPNTLGMAIESFEADEYLMGAMPEELTRIFLQLKRDEWARYCGIITQWEFDQYWEAIP